jgi:hypothetical protein
MINQLASSHSAIPDNTTIVQQGYLQAFRNGEATKVFAVLTNKQLSLYTEDPSKTSAAILISSIDVSKSKVLEEGNFKRPKSFGVFSDQSFLEFSCATNSARISWLKSIHDAKEVSESLQKLKGIKASMDFYRAPTAVGRPSVQASSSTLPTSRAGPVADVSTSSNAIFSDTFAQLRALNGVSASQQQLQHSNFQHQHPQVSFAAPSMPLQPALKKNLLAKPAVVSNRAASSSQNQRGEVKETPRWVPGHYKAPTKPNNRSVTPQKLPQQSANTRANQRPSSAPGPRPESKGQNHGFFTPVGESNVFSVSGMDDYSSHRGIPLSLNTLQPSVSSHHQAPNAVQSANSHHHHPSQYPSYEENPVNPYSQHPSYSPAHFPAYSQPPHPAYAHPSSNIPTSMEHLTLAQIRAALMSIPVPIRSALMNDTGKNQQDEPATHSRVHASTSGINSQRTVEGRNDLLRASKNRSQQRNTSEDLFSSDGNDSSVDSGYIASGGKARERTSRGQHSNEYHRAPYQEEELLGTTTYSDSQFHMHSRRASVESDIDNDAHADDANGYGLANIYSNGGSPDLQYARNDTDLQMSARSNPMLKSRSLELNSLRSGPTKSKNPNESMPVKKSILEQAKRPNPLQRSKSAPIQRPVTSKLPVRSPLGRVSGDLQPTSQVNTANNTQDKELRESTLSWSKRQARDKRIGTNYFGNTKKGAQLIQGQPLPSENRTESNSPQRRHSVTESVPILEFSKPLALRKNFASSQGQDGMASKLGSSQGSKLKTPPTATAATTTTPKSFFDFKKSSKTLDVATGCQANATSSMLHSATTNGNAIGIGNNAMQTQQQLNLEAQLQKYQQRLQSKRAQSSTNALSSGSALGGEKPAVPSSSGSQQQKFQMEYLAKRNALLAMPINGRVRPKPIRPQAPAASQPNSFQSTPSRPRQLSSESYESCANANGDEEITDRAEWHRFRSWLESIGMEHYLSLMRDNGVTKLSVLELLTGDDLAQIGMSEMDAAIILQKARQLTEQIKSFSENVDFDDWNTASNNGGLASSRLTTPTSFSRRKETSYSSRLPESPGSASAVPLTTDKIVELKGKLIQSYKSGDLDKFFVLWERLPTFPKRDSQLRSHDLNALLRSERPALVSAKQAMEFHLYLYFFVFSLKYAGSNKIPVLKAKSALRKYLDKIANSHQEYQSLNSPNKASSPISSAQALQQLNATSSPAPVTKMFSGDVSPTNHTLSSTQASLETARSLYSTREFATFAGLVFVPNPQANLAFQSLFRDEWSAALQERLKKFLDAVLPEETKVAEKEVILNEPKSHLETSLNSAMSAISINNNLLDRAPASISGADVPADIIRPAPVRPTDVSISMQSGNESSKFASTNAISPMHHIQVQNLLTNSTQSGSSTKLPSKVPSSASSFAHPFPQNVSAQSVRSSTYLTAQPSQQQSDELMLQDNTHLIPVDPIATELQTDNSIPDEKKNPEVVGLEQVRDTCVSPASSISQLTDDTPLNRVTASLGGQIGPTQGNHTMNAWLQSQPATTVAGQRPLRAKPALGSPSNTSNNNSARRIVVGNVPPTTVLMPLNQRNLLSIQQQQQLQQFQQQFGYAPISPGGSRVSGGRSSSQVNNNGNINSTPGPHTSLENSPGDNWGSSTDQVDIPPMATSSSQAHPSITKASSIPSSPLTANQEGTNNNAGLPQPSRQKPGVAPQNSTKSSLQSQVDNYNRLLKLKKLPKQPSQSVTPNQSTGLADPSILNSEEQAGAVFPDDSPARGEPTEPITTEEAADDNNYVVMQELDEIVSPERHEVEPLEKISNYDYVQELPEQEIDYVEMPDLSNLAVREPIESVSPVIEVVEVVEEKDTVDSSFPSPTGVIADSMQEIPADVSPSAVGWTEEPPVSHITDVPSEAVTSFDPEVVPQKPEEVLDVNTLPPTTAEVDAGIPEAIVTEIVAPEETFPKPANVEKAISISLDTSAFSVANMYGESLGNVGGMNNPFSSSITTPSTVEQSLSPQQAAKYKVLLRNSQKKKKNKK